MELKDVKVGQKIIVKSKECETVQLHGEVVGYSLQFKLLSTGNIMVVEINDYELLEVLEG